MSEPNRHHYLPEFYLSRWTVDGVLWRFLRPRGPKHEIHARRVAPKAIGFQPNLYAYPRPEDPRHRQTIEADFLQKIDSKGAASLKKLEGGEAASPNDKIHIVQLLLSFIHRTPGRIQFLQNELRNRLPKDFNPEQLPDDFFRHSALGVFTDLVASDMMISELVRFSIFLLSVGENKHRLMTSDRPTILSDGLHHIHSFVMLPIGPNKLLILAKSRDVPDAFANQPSGKLITAINDAVVTQAEALAIGNKISDRHFIDKRLQRQSFDVHNELKSDGLIRWRAPL
ncbi:DUF4238 domain-containing protein [Qipengyuania sp. YG27]|uniref:DUF4238 domain-containing protein n=1 Tax=Qipengyuania mesophila TaxID=2867246 RepID=A0ABS7JW45_9SPHN|nr:DUF4238 domain-containing protein [Qipengyuania mesophila]MBX7501885.1 DUF4238 domain-containing protein [Qipengyuania mesophila]